MLFGSQNNQRRRDVRKVVPKMRPSFKALLRHPAVWWTALYGTIFVILTATIVLESREQPRFRPGQIVDKAQVARVQFQSVDVLATNRAREDARRRTPNVYVANSAFIEETSKRFLALPATVATATGTSDVEESLVKTFGLTTELITELKMFQMEGRPTNEWAEHVRTFMSHLYSSAILGQDRFQLEYQNLARTIILKQGDEGPDLPVPEGGLINFGDKTEQLPRRIGDLAVQFPETVRDCVVNYFLESGEPTYLFDSTASDKRKNESAESVENVEVVYEIGQELVIAGTLLDETGHELLVKEQQEYVASLSPAIRWGRIASQVLIIGFLTIGLTGALLAFKPRVIQNSMRSMALLLLMVTMLATAWIGRSVGPQFGVAMPMASVILVGVILTIVYERRIAVGVVGIQTLITGLAFNLTLGECILILSTGIIAIVQLRELRHRTTLVRDGFLTGVVAFVGIWMVSLSEKNMVEGLPTAILIEAGWSFALCVTVGFFVLGVLPFVERMFKVTTSMTLLELCDINQPLLRRLAQVAPGTFNHSLQMGVMAEAAAESIGANGLLCRVGAYYHDIGKMNKPNYFIENQGGGPNRHDKLSPAMSLLILVGHVKDGMEMAREYGLPRVLHHFIESHHGTTLVEYFYRAAQKQHTESAGDEPSEVQFRYPGPKPQTKEAAIMMLCDCIESACRTLAEPNPGRIEQLVHTMATKRLMDGQFDQCNLTLAELGHIELAITRSLCAIYHGRITYPSAEKEESQPAKDESPQSKAG